MDTKPDNFCSNSISDQSIVINKKEAKALEELEYFIVHPLYIRSTSKHTVDYFYKVSLSLDDLKIRDKQSCVLESSKDLIKALFHYQGADI
jgi:hypothetical protein